MSKVKSVLGYQLLRMFSSNTSHVYSHLNQRLIHLYLYAWDVWSLADLWDALRAAFFFPFYLSFSSSSFSSSSPFFSLRLCHTGYTWTSYVVQPGFELLETLLTQSPNFWNYRNMPLCLDQDFFLFILVQKVCDFSFNETNLFSTITPLAQFCFGAKI